MAKKKNQIAYYPEMVPYTAEENESRFKREYEFDKPPPARAPVNGWQYNAARDGDAYIPPKARALITGQPHTFKGMRLGNRYSSRPGGHRIGSRKK